MRETILLAENISEDVSSSCEQTNLFLLHLQCQNRISLVSKIKSDRRNGNGWTKYEDDLSLVSQAAKRDKKSACGMFFPELC